MITPGLEETAMRAVIASAFPREREETKAVLSALGCEEICLCAGGVAALN